MKQLKPALFYLCTLTGAVACTVLFPNQRDPATVPMLAKPYIEQVVQPAGPVVHGTLDVVFATPVRFKFGPAPGDQVAT